MKKFLLFFLLIILLIGGSLGFYGYSLYDKAIKEEPLASKIEEIQSDKNYIKFSKLPKDYLNAVVSVEDRRFYKHGAIDLRSIGRAIYVNITNFDLREGGSTITQQLAKNIYFIDMDPFPRKLAEIFMAYAIEDNYSKEEILELYVNTSYFGDGYYGIKEACNGYLNKEPSQTNLNECTMMAGIPNAPSVYAPTKNPDLTKSRQKHVLKTMVENGYITQEEADRDSGTVLKIPFFIIKHFPKIKIFLAN